MTFVDPARRRPAWVALFAATAAVACALKISLAWRTFGTDDVAIWQANVAGFRAFGGAGLYHQVEGFIHPPFMIHVVRLLDFLAAATATPFPFWLRLPGIVADVGSGVLVWKILERGLEARALRPALVLLAAAPAAVMISGFHGNTDALMIFFLLLSIFLLERGGREWLAGAAFGMSISIKAWPVIFVPAIFLSLPQAGARLKYFAAAAAIVVGGSLPYLAQDPWIIATRILGYRSLPNWWGLTRLTRKLPSDLRGVKWFYDTYGRFVTLGGMVLASLWMNRLPRKPPLFFQCGLLAFLFLSLTAGFGVQYLAWLVPWVVALGVGVAAVYYATSGVFLFLVYTYWSGGLPWDVATSGNWGWRLPIVVFELLCWASVVAILGVYVRRALAPDRPGRGLRTLTIIQSNPIVPPTIESSLRNEFPYTK